jgi:peptidoglycan/xylan/chitin deacetylase (PgdA/CDA1 family)
MTGKRPRVTLTFDNGPTPGVTAGVLDVLRERAVLATFFVVGERLRSADGRAIAAAATDDGHWLGNHTLTHSVELGRVSDQAVARREIDEAQDALGELASPDKLFRPWGRGQLGPTLLSEPAVGHLCREGYTCVLWNSVPRDWAEPVDWVETCLQDVSTRDWSLVVLHDLDTGAMRRLPEFLDRAREKGFELVQEFPDSCVPIRRGVLQWSVDHLIPVGESRVHACEQGEG